MKKVTAESKINFLSGVGEKKAALYNKIGIYTVRDLLLHIPRNYIKMDESNPSLVYLKITKSASGIRARGGLLIFNLLGETREGEVYKIVYYNMQFLAKSLKEGESYYLYGQVESNLTSKKITCPQIIKEEYIGHFMPIYSSTIGLSGKIIAKDINTAFNSLDKPLEDIVPVIKGLPTLWQALTILHEKEDQLSRDRISFEKMYIYALAMLYSRGLRKKQHTKPITNTDLTSFYNLFPYKPTEGQINAIQDIAKDLSSGLVMNRLLEGDVGCGKTYIASAAAYLMIKNGMQVAMMVPTEILAEQQYNNLSSKFNCMLITGSTSKKSRDTKGYDLIIGTHALFSEDVKFYNLGLVITDEQHRFGVMQRAGLENKGVNPHVLVMSATPIPRTLSLVLYGDLDISIIKTLPNGRKPIETLVIDSSKLIRALNFIKNNIEKGNQAYIVFPNIEDATSFYEEQKNNFSSIALLHGQMKAKDKDLIMRKFSSGETKILISTTVIEVGVDVPNAVIMLIMNANHFGLSQLHQLRGRVGRGEHKSYCILHSDSNTQKSNERLLVLKNNRDGFTIANEDLRLRGPGDMLGTNQHGLNDIFFVSKPELIELAQTEALKLLQSDPKLERNPKLLERVEPLLNNLCTD